MSTIPSKFLARQVNPVDFACNNGTVPQVGFAVQDSATQTMHTYNMAFAGNTNPAFTTAVVSNLAGLCKPNIAASSANCGLPDVQECTTLYDCTVLGVPNSVLLASAAFNNDVVTLNADYAESGDSFQACAEQNLGQALADAEQAGSRSAAPSAVPSTVAGSTPTATQPPSMTTIVVTALPTPSTITLSNPGGGVETTTVCFNLNGLCVPVNATLGATVAASIIGATPVATEFPTFGSTSAASAAARRHVSLKHVLAAALLGAGVLVHA